MSNPFDDPDGAFLVLANAHDQHSLWPAFLDVPTGWSTVHGPDSRQACLDVVSRRWAGATTAAGAR
jgi:MbtH protein